MTESCLFSAGRVYKPASRLSLLLERTRKEFLSAVDPTFIHHKLYTKQLPTKNATGSVYKELRSIGKGSGRRWEAVFSTDSATIPGIVYTQRVVLSNLEELIRNRKSDLSFVERVRYAVEKGDIKINCTCPAHLFWGYKYINTFLGTTAPGARENRSPDIRNDQLRGIMCKHMNLVLKVIPFNISSITSDLKDKLKMEPFWKKRLESYGMDRLSSLILEIA